MRARQDGRRSSGSDRADPRTACSNTPVLQAGGLRSEISDMRRAITKRGVMVVNLTFETAADPGQRGTIANWRLYFNFPFFIPTLPFL